MKKIKLDIGCGPRKRSPEHIGIDRFSCPQVDIKLDFESEKLPFPNNSVDEILASHILEHIKNYLPLVREMWRVLKQDGRLEVAVPHYLHESATTDPTHVRKFTRRSFHFFDERKVEFRETGWYLDIARFKIEEIKETEKEIVYNLKAKKRNILFVGPSSSVHTKRWKEYIAATSNRVIVASRVKKDFADIGLGNRDLSREDQIEQMPASLEGILEVGDFDTVHVNFATRYGHLLRNVKGIRKILSVWGEDVLDEAIRRDVEKMRLTQGLASTDIVTTTSKDMAEHLMREYGVEKRRIWTIPWGYGRTFVEPSEDEKNVFKELGIENVGDTFFLSARVCRPQNNIENIVDAFMQLRVNAGLVILTGKLSDKEYISKIRKKTKQRVAILPTIDEEQLKALYRRAVATISIPFVDQLNTTILESLISGTPVICSDLAVYKERVKDHYNGWLVNPCNIENINSAMKMALEKRDDKQMKENARISVIKDDWASNAERMIKLYDIPLDYDTIR